MTTRNYRIRFCENNYAELITSSISYTTQLSAFPFSNAINKFRSRVWRPSGHFLINDDNNKLYLNDTGGDFTVTLTNDSYATPALLAAHIETQINLSANDTWTCTYDSVGGTYRFNFTSTGSSELRLTQTTNAIWDTIGYTTASDLTGTTFNADQQRNHTSEYVTFDLGTNAEITFFALIGPLDEVFSISNNATIKLMASNLNQWDTPPFDINIDITDKGAQRFLDDQDDTAYRFWRVEIIDKTNPNGPEGISIGHLYLGDYITLTDKNVSIGFELTDVDPSGIIESESGVLHFDSKTHYTQIDGASIGLLERSDKDVLLEMYERLGSITPFYVSLDPTLCITNSVDDLTKYVVFSGQPKFKHIINDIFSMSLSLREVI